MEAPLRLSANFMIAGAPVFKFFIPYGPAEYSAPAIVDNIVYVGSADGYFYAIDLIKGREIWEFPTTGAVESSPTVSDGRVYFGTGKGILYCLDSKDGREIWRFQAKAEIISSPVVEDGVIYFNSADDKLYALKAGTGEKLWQYSRRYIKKIVKRTFASPAVYGDKIYCNFADGYIVAVEKSSGREVWQKAMAGEDHAGAARFTPTIDNGLVYLINGDGFLVGLDAETGEERWRFDTIKISDFTASKGYMFIAGYDGSVIAMNKSGKIIWKGKTSQGIPVSMIIADKYLVVASNYKTENTLSTDIGSYVDIFDTDTGVKAWNENIDSTVSASLSAAYNHLLLVTDHGYLRIYKSSQ
ncbi:MAG: PQQ-binding-like beta-propeller repeat protein [Deltaproteobacteria bacterium]|nr:PQQ-binding-like beta-propeller repeat protein [Deltaproteobacteria bacterium]